jgi:sugar phosphate isomerase/epimerase
MYPFKIGVIPESFRVERFASLEKAASIGAKGVQVYATHDDFCAENLTADQKKAFLTRLQDLGLVVSALCGDFGKGFTDPELNKIYVERSKRVLDLALEFGTDVVTTHIGRVPDDDASDTYKIMQEACGELAAYADSLKAHFAVETGPETSLTLKGFLDSLHSRGVSVNLDPANLVMVTGDDPVQAVYNLRDYIVHTHAKDGVKLYDKDPELIYGVKEDSLVTSPSFEEVPLGAGSVPFPAYLAALEDVGYRGYLTIEREVGEDPAADIALAVRFLRGLTR